jgi:hypothetical protein
MTRQFQGHDQAVLVPDGEGTVYQKTLTFWGAVPEDVEKMFRDGSKAILQQHFRAYVEDGTRYAKG